MYEEFMWREPLGDYLKTLRISVPTGAQFYGEEFLYPQEEVRGAIPKVVNGVSYYEHWGMRWIAVALSPAFVQGEKIALMQLIGVPNGMADRAVHCKQK